MGDNSMIDTVEEEIRRAEALLAHDIMHVGDDWSPGKQRRPAPDQPRVPNTRRKKLLDELRAERTGRGGVPATELSQTARNQDHNVIEETAKAPPPPATPSALNSSVGMTAPTPGGTERDILIARLLAEREAKLKNEQYQKQHGQQNSVQATNHNEAQASEIVESDSKNVVAPPENVRSTQPQGAHEASFVANPETTFTTSMSLPVPSIHTSDPVPRPAPSMTPSTSATPNISLSQLHSAASLADEVGKVDVFEQAQSPMKWATSTRSKRFSRRTKDDVRREAEKRQESECTFRPKINSRSRASAKTNAESRKQRFRRLSSTHEAREKYLADARAKAEAKVMEECTFKPRINKRSSTGDSGQKSQQEGVGVSSQRKQTVPDRLHYEADARAIARQKMQRRLEKQELESHPFKPSINKRSAEILDMSHYKPIHKRVNDIQRAKHASRLAEKLNRDASNPDLTFHPKINNTSKLLVESRRMDTEDPDQFDVTTRLMKDAKEASARSFKRQKAYMDEKAADLSFQPKISQASQEIIAHNANYMGPEGRNFLKRQMRLKKKHEKEKAERIREAARRSECTFKPDTGTASEVLRHTRPHRLRESSLERTERLYRQDLEAKKKKRAGEYFPMPCLTILIQARLTFHYSFTIPSFTQQLFKNVTSRTAPSSQV